MAKDKKKKRRATSKYKAAALSPKVMRSALDRAINMITSKDKKGYQRKLKDFKEDFPTFFALGSPGDFDPAVSNFRRFGRRVVSTDLDETRQERQYTTSVILYHKAPTARYFTDLRVAFLTAGEMSVEAKDPKVAAWIQAYLSDPFTDYENFRPLLGRESILAGELLLYPHVNPSTGHVRIAYLSPAFIKGRPAPAPGFPHIPDRIAIRKQALRELGIVKPIKGKLGESGHHGTPLSSDQGLTGATNETILKIIRPRIEMVKAIDDKGKEIETPTEKLSGDVFFIPFNRLLSSLRGHSQFLVSSDQLDAVDEALFAMIERLYLLNLFCWHITYEGYSEAKLREKRRDFEADGGIKPGATFMTNEKGKIEGVSADLGTADFVTGFDKALNVAAMAFGIPQAWLGLGDLVNRASAQVSETPIMKLLQQGRQQFRAMEKKLIEYHVLQGVEKGTLRGIEDTSFKISYEELSKHDQTDVVNAASTIAGAISVGLDRQLITHEQAKKLFTFIAEQIVKLPAAPVAPGEATDADPTQSTAQDKDFGATDPEADARSDQRADAAAGEMIENMREAKRLKREAANV